MPHSSIVSTDGIALATATGLLGIHRAAGLCFAISSMHQVYGYTSFLDYNTFLTPMEATAWHR
jgi:hypothetical protein